MQKSLLRSRTVLVTPLVLLTVALLEDIVTFKVRQQVRSVGARAAIILVLNGAAFAAAAEWASPLLKRLFAGARSSTRRGLGSLGSWMFYACAYGALYAAYWTIERRGPGGLLFRSVR
jgi:hypothetical protein